MAYSDNGRNTRNRSTGIAQRIFAAVNTWQDEDTKIHPRSQAAHRFAESVEAVADGLSNRMCHWYVVNWPTSSSLEDRALI